MRKYLWRRRFERAYVGAAAAAQLLEAALKTPEALKTLTKFLKSPKGELPSDLFRTKQTMQKLKDRLGADLKAIGLDQPNREMLDSLDSLIRQRNHSMHEYLLKDRQSTAALREATQELTQMRRDFLMMGFPLSATGPVY